MTKQIFKSNETYMPVTMSQFEDLTNEILEAINKVCDPHFLSADYAAQILMSALHAYDHKQGIVLKSELFNSCINRISCHVSYHAVEAIQAKLQAEEEAKAAATLVTNSSVPQPSTGQENLEAQGQNQIN